MQPRAQPQSKSPTALRTASVSTSISSTPSTPQHPPCKPPRVTPPTQEIAALHTKINGSSQSLTGLKAKNRDLKAKIAEMKREIAKLDETHACHQRTIQRNEREIATRRGSRQNGTDLRPRKIELTLAEAGLFGQVKDLVQGHICEIEMVGADAGPEQHHNPVVNIMLAQTRLFLGQMHQQEVNYLRMVTRFEKQEELLEGNISSLKSDLSSIRSPRFTDPPHIEKLHRDEDFPCDSVKRKRCGQSLDLRSSDPSLSTVYRLKDKPPGKECEVIRTQEGRLRRGVDF